MVVHVGVDFSMNKYCVYDTVKNIVKRFTYNEYKSKTKIKEIAKILEEIKLKINDELGCAYYQQINCKFVLIKSDFIINVWQSKDGTVDYINTLRFNEDTFYNDIENDVDEIIIFYSNGINFREEEISKSKCICCDFNPTMGALYKSRMIGNDPNVFYYDVKSVLGTSLVLNVDDVEILHVEYGETLPVSKQVIYEMPNIDSTLTTVEVITNFLYSIKYLDVSNGSDNHAEYKHLTKTDKTIIKNAKTSDKYLFPAKIQVNDDQINAVGIDLGTTRCCTAVNRRNGMETVALENTGGKLLSSWVGFDEGKTKCGQVVADRLRNHAQSTVFDVKRIIGKRINEVKIDESWPFEISSFYKITKNDAKYESDLFIKILGSNIMTYKRAEEVSAVLLKYIKEKTEEFQGKCLNEAVVTVPVAFNENQMQATYEAALLAGWETVHLIPEPVAAAFAYFIDRPIPNDKNLLLFDLGGGTLDVCIFKVQNNQLKIIGRSGDPNIGGRDFDNLLIEYFENKLIDDFGIKKTKYRRYKLMQKCQNIKEYLSVEEEDYLDVEEIDYTADGFIPITRNEFEEMSSQLLKTIRQSNNAALKKIQHTHEHVEMILHVGGGCRMPMIKDLLQNLFPNSEHIREQNIDEVVAVGAAYYAYYLNEKEKRNCSVM